MTIRLTLLLAVLLAACVSFYGVPPEEIMGRGTHRYAWDAKWPQRSFRDGLGSTHGEIAVDPEGRLLITTDTAGAVMVFEQDGTFVRSWGAEFAGGLHGLRLGRWAGEPALLLAHTGLHAAFAVTLDGSEVLWTAPFPEASELYDEGGQYRPTNIAQAPDGRIFVADGYGKGYVHRYDAQGVYLGSFGGPGSEPGRFATPHGVWVDTRREVPELLVADRENHRLQRFDLEGNLLGVVVGPFRRPCMVQQRGDDLVVADLAGRVTVLDGENRLITHLGDQPDPEKRAVNGVPVEDWQPREFLAPHAATWTPDGDLIVMDWNASGRVSRLRRLD